MRILWHGNAPWNNSGYGKMTRLFIPRINKTEHEVVAIAAPYSFGVSILEYDGIPVLGAANDSSGNDTILLNHEYFNADLTITLADPFGLIKSATDLSQINLAMLFPVDTNPVGDGDIAVLRESQALPIAISQFGYRTLRNEGAEPLYVPHAVDTNIYCPGDPEPYRDTIPQINPETFVIGMCAMNRDPQRKGFAEQMLAFTDFHARHPDSVLALHTAPVINGGLNLHKMAARLGITDAIAWPDSYSYSMGMVTEEQMATWYRGLDVLSMCSYGEGFGLPLIEAQACGIPVITTDASATSELCGAGWIVSSTPFWTNGHASWWQRPDIEDIIQAYDTAYYARSNGILPQKQAREFAMNYDADYVFNQYMVPALKTIENRIL